MSDPSPRLRFPWFIVLGLIGGYAGTLLALNVLELPGIVVMIAAAGAVIALVLEHTIYAVQRRWHGRVRRSSAPPLTPSTSPLTSAVPAPPSFPLPPSARHRR